MGAVKWSIRIQLAMGNAWAPIERRIKDRNFLQTRQVVSAVRDPLPGLQSNKVTYVDVTDGQTLA